MLFKVLQPVAAWLGGPGGRGPPGSAFFRGAKSLGGAKNPTGAEICKPAKKRKQQKNEEVAKTYY